MELTVLACFGKFYGMLWAVTDLGAVHKLCYAQGGGGSAQVLLSALLFRIKALISSNASEKGGGS